MTELKDLKVGDEVTLTIKARVSIRDDYDGVEYVYFEFANEADYIPVEEGNVKSGAVSIKRAPRPLPSEPGVYVPSTNKDSAHWSVIYKRDGDGWRYSDGVNHVSGTAALEDAKHAHENLGGLVRLVPEQ